MSNHFRVRRREFIKRDNVISILKDKLGVYGVRIFQAGNITGKIVKERKMSIFMFGIQ